MSKTVENLLEILGEVVYQKINGVEKCIDPYKHVTTDLSRFSEAYQIYKETMLPGYDKPFIYYHSIGNNYGFDALNYDQDTIDYCNQHGLEIFFNELLTNSVGEKFVFYPTFLHKVDDLYPKLQFEWEHKDNHLMHCFELEGVRKFINRNKLKNVTLYVGAKDTFDIYKHKYPDLKLVYKDIFLQSIVGQLIKYKTSENRINIENIEYNFWCGNLRYMTYRHIVAAYLTNYNSSISFGHKGSMSQLKNLLWFDLENWKSTQTEEYNKIKKGVVDLNKKTRFIDKPFSKTSNLTGTAEDYLNYPEYEQDPKEPIYYTHCVPELYSNTFCAVVTESIFAQPISTVSEKPFNAIQNFRPFLIVGPPYTLKLLKEMGFQTFGDYWDESYDTEIDHEQRLIKLLNIMDKIGNMSLLECKDMCKHMMPILEHNYNNINQNLFDKILNLN